MYSISKGRPEDIILTCRDCSHIESVSQFNLSLGSQRTQAAKAMQAHARDKHPVSPAKLMLRKTYEALASGAVSRHAWTRPR
jgi:hypothetical protein